MTKKQKTKKQECQKTEKSDKPAKEEKSKPVNYLKGRVVLALKLDDAERVSEALLRSECIEVKGVIERLNKGIENARKRLQ